MPYTAPDPEQPFDPHSQDPPELTSTSEEESEIRGQADLPGVKAQGDMQRPTIQKAAQEAQAEAQQAVEATPDFPILKKLMQWLTQTLKSDVLWSIPLDARPCVNWPQANQMLW